jgi:hypothetical protein
MDRYYIRFIYVSCTFIIRSIYESVTGEHRRKDDVTIRECQL